MDDQVVFPDSVSDDDFFLSGLNESTVTCLASRFSIERCSVKHKLNSLAAP